MSYTYTALIQYQDSDGRFANLTAAPTVTAYDLAGNSISSPAIANIAVGAYKVSVTQDDLEDVLFRVVPHADDQAAFPDVAVMQDKVTHVADEILTDTGTNGVVLKAAGLAADAVAEIADGIWDEALSGHATAGTAGKTLADVDVSGVAAAVWAYANRTLSSFGTLISSIWAFGTRTLTGVTTTQFNLIGPVRNDGKIEALAGDDYYAADGRAMSWKDTSWPDLTGATVKFINGSTEITMTVTNPGSGVEQTLSMDVPKATSTAMKGEFKFILQATLASTHVVTLLEGEGRFK